MLIQAFTLAGQPQEDELTTQLDQASFSPAVPDPASKEVQISAKSSFQGVDIQAHVGQAVKAAEDAMALAQSQAAVAQHQAAVAQHRAAVAQHEAAVAQQAYMMAQQAAVNSKEAAAMAAYAVQQANQLRLLACGPAVAPQDSLRARQEDMGRQENSLRAREAALFRREADAKAREVALELQKAAFKAKEASLNAREVALEMQKAALKAKEVALDITPMEGGDALFQSREDSPGNDLLSGTIEVSPRILLNADPAKKYIINAARVLASIRCLAPLYLFLQGCK